MTIGKRVRKIRKSKGLSQKAFAGIIGVGQSHISQVESGQAEASTQLIKSMALAFGVREQWLKDGDGPIKVNLAALPIDEFNKIACAEDFAPLGHGIKLGFWRGRVPEKEFAKLLGISVEEYRKYENGDVRPSASLLKKAKKTRLDINKDYSGTVKRFDCWLFSEIKRKFDDGLGKRKNQIHPLAYWNFLFFMFEFFTSTGEDLYKRGVSDFVSIWISRIDMGSDDKPG